jgi:hypothetical protein
MGLLYLYLLNVFKSLGEIEHCTVHNKVTHHDNCLDDNNYGNADKEEEVQNRFHNASSLEFVAAQLQREGINETFFTTIYVTSLEGSHNEDTFQICPLLAHNAE